MENILLLPTVSTNGLAVKSSREHGRQYVTRSLHALTKLAKAEPLRGLTGSHISVSSSEEQNRVCVFFFHCLPIMSHYVPRQLSYFNRHFVRRPDSLAKIVSDKNVRQIYKSDSNSLLFFRGNPGFASQ